MHKANRPVHSSWNLTTLHSVIHSRSDLQHAAAVLSLCARQLLEKIARSSILTVLEEATSVTLHTPRRPTASPAASRPRPRSRPSRPKHLPRRPRSHSQRSPPSVPWSLDHRWVRLLSSTASMMVLATSPRTALETTTVGELGSIGADLRSC